MNKIIKRTAVILIVTAALLFLSFRLSPYPSTWVIRYLFNKEAISVNKALEQFVPSGIETISNIRYDEKDGDALFDIHFPTDSARSEKKLPVVVWTHGGGLISGDKSQVGNYCRILASKGYVVVSIDYTIAPEGKYPTPIQQLNKALAFIAANAERFHADSSSFVLAGDSGGSMIAATAANTITSPSYARATKVEPGLNPGQLKGLLLYCGIYEVDNLKTEGSFGAFLKTVTWAYFDKKDISADAYAKTASVTNFLTSQFPRTFISAGNKDPLLPQSQLLASKLSALNVPIDTLFFPGDREPGLPHEYQFRMDEAGKLALGRSVSFLNSIR